MSRYRKTNMLGLSASAFALASTIFLLAWVGEQVRAHRAMMARRRQVERRSGVADNQAPYLVYGTQPTFRWSPTRQTCVDVE